MAVLLILLIAFWLKYWKKLVLKKILSGGIKYYCKIKNHAWGTTTNYFKIEKGTRQGDPISA